MKNKILLVLVLIMSFVWFTSAENWYKCNNFEDLDNFYSEDSISLKATNFDYSKDKLFAYYPYRHKPVYDYAQIPYDKFDIFLHAFIRPQSDGTLYIPEYIVYPEFINEVHKNGKKVLISIWWYNNSFNFTTIMEDSQKRETFFKSIKDFIEKYNYDWIDLDWEFPRNDEQWEQYLQLLKSLKVQFKDKIITTALNWAPNYSFIDLCRLQYYVDYIFFMSYDFEWWQWYAWYNAPLYKNSHMKIDRSIYKSLTSNYLPYIKNSKKIVLGYPLYWKMFLIDKFYKNIGYNSTVNFADLEFTWCQKSFDTESLVPYLECWDNVVSYDDIISFYYKRLFYKNNNLWWMFFWALWDDKNWLINYLSLTWDLTRSISMDDNYSRVIDGFQRYMTFWYIQWVEVFLSNIKTTYSTWYWVILDNIERNIIRVVYQEQKLKSDKTLENLFKYLLFKVVYEKASLIREASSITKR